MVLRVRISQKRYCSSALKNRLSNRHTGKNEGTQSRTREQGGQERQGLLRKPRRARLSRMRGACRAVMGKRLE